MRARPILAVLTLAAAVAVLCAAPHPLPAAAASASPAAQAVGPMSTIESGVPWTADNGSNGLLKIVQAHTPSLLRVDGLTYMLGNDWSSGNGFSGVGCYVSSGLDHWQYRGVALAADSRIPDLAPGGIVQRPRVIYNAATRTYVMWMHIDSSDYTESRVGVAVSSSPCGPYRYLRSFRPLGHPSRDIGLFQDDDGSAYLLSADHSVRGLRIDRLSPDYTRVVRAGRQHGGSVNVLRATPRRPIEAPALVKVDGTYWLFGSHPTGYRENDNVTMSASRLDGSWSCSQLFAESGSRTDDSQTDGILVVDGTRKTTVVYLGDRWCKNALPSSTHVWLPLDFSSGCPHLSVWSRWAINMSTGVWSGLAP